MRVVVNEHIRIPTATYRLQFNKNFTYRQAREIVSYLHHLGISDAYASPYFQAGAESLHGYDITDHNKLMPRSGRGKITMHGSLSCMRTAWDKLPISSLTTWELTIRKTSGG